jgi:hypothetical protein
LPDNWTALSQVKDGMPCLPVMRMLGGCGGTLLARLFGALSDTVVLSETNPRSAVLFGGSLNPILQIQKWHPTLLGSVADFDKYEIGYPPRFGEMLERLYIAARDRGLTLIIRDYNYVDFIGIPFVWPVPCNFSLDLSVDGRFQLNDFVFVRSPAAQLASLRNHDPVRSVLTAEHFLDSYRAFLAAKPNTPIFRYEDLVMDPRATFRKMCTTLGIRWDPRALDRFSAVKTVTGDMTKLTDSTITLPKPSDASAQAESELLKLPGYNELLSVLGYRAGALATKLGLCLAFPPFFLEFPARYRLVGSWLSEAEPLLRSAL